VPVQPERDTRITVPQLRLDNCNRRSAVDEFAGYRVAKRVKSSQRYPQLGEQRSQLFLSQFVRRVRAAPAIYEQQAEIVLTIVA